MRCKVRSKFDKKLTITIQSGGRQEGTMKDGSDAGKASSDDILNVATLKVAELKEELGKRGLPTNGLKKDLSSRLQEALDQSAEVEAVPSEQATTQKQASLEVADVDDVHQEETAAEDGPAEHSREDVANETKASVEKEEVQLDDGNGLDSITETAEGGKVEEVVAAEDTVSPILVDTGRTASIPDEKVERVESLAERMGEKDDVNNVEEVELGGDLEVEVEMAPVAEPKINSDEVVQRDSMSIATVESEAMEEDVKKLTSYHPDGLSPHDDPPTMLPSDAASSAKALADLDEQSSQAARSSRSLCIVGLVRPLTIASFRSKVEDYGPVEEVWLDGVKTHAYVTYRDEESASQAKSSMSGTVYPSDTGKVISVHYIPESITKNCITIEEMAWQEERGKMELRARLRTEDEGSLLYSLHRLDSGATSRLESTLPARSVNNQRGPSLANRIHSQAGSSMRVEAPKLEWGAGPSANYRDRHREAPRSYDGRQGPPARQEYRGYNGREGYGSRGPSRADERVREVEARIMAERERGTRAPPSEASSYKTHRAYDRHPPADDRWARDRGSNPSWDVRSNGRNREYSPPAERRRHAEGGRDEFGRDRF